MDASLLLGQYAGEDGYGREKVVELFIFVGGAEVLRVERDTHAFSGLGWWNFQLTGGMRKLEEEREGEGEEESYYIEF